MSSLGIFAQECSTFLELLGNVDLEKNCRTYCVRKMMIIAIRSTFYILCCRNRNGKVRTFNYLKYLIVLYIYVIIFMYSVLSFLLVHIVVSYRN
jgi:hypothetical protein